MDSAFKTEGYSQFTEVYSGAAACDAATETVVPDTMPDIGEILDTEGLVLLRSKQTREDGVTVCVVIEAAVLYAPEDGGAPCCLRLSLPAELNADAPGADADCQTTARLRLRALDARAVNPRKLSLRAELVCELCCRRAEEFFLPCAPAQPRVQAKPETARLLLTTDVQEKSFVVTDEYALPAELGASDILLRRVTLFTEDVKYAAGKLVFHGRAQVFLLLAGETADDLRPCAFETAFSQIMEADGSDAEATEVTLSLTGAYFDLSGGKNGGVTAELHMAAQAVCRAAREVAYIADAYCPGGELTAQLARLPVASDCAALSVRQTLTGFLELPGEGTQPLFFRVTVGGVSVSAEGVSAAVSVRAVFRRQDGSFGAGSVRLTGVFAPELSHDMQLLPAQILAPAAYHTQNGQGMELRVPAELRTLAVRRDTLCYVSGMLPCEDGAGGPVPSAALIRADASAELWELAKRHHSTVEAILAANDGRGEGLLLIPRCK